MRFESRVVVVTGAANGIGAAVAAGYAAQHATVYGLDHAWPNEGSAAGVERVACELTDEAMVRSRIADIESRHGAVDILINNAALSGDVEPKPFDEITRDEWMHTIENNTLAPFLCVKAVAPKMRERRYGRIVNFTSGTVFVGVPRVLAYVTSKGAVAVMTKALAKELGGDGITVNAVAPGLTATEKMKANPGWTPEIWQRSVQNRSIQREETADDLVGACLFLTGEDAAFVTGQILVVDGGYVFN